MRFLPQVVSVFLAFTLSASSQALEQENPLTLLQRESDNVSEVEALELLKRNPSDVAAHITLAAVAERRGKLDVARGYLLHALAVSPDNPEVHHQLALNFGHRRDWNKAVREILEALRIRPDHSIYRFNLGVLFYNSGSYPQALEQFRRALQLEPHSFAFHFSFASTLEAEKKLLEAEAEFTKIIDRHPRQARAFSVRGALLLQLGKSEEARRDAEKAISLDPTLADAHYLLGKIYEQTQDLQRAVKAYSRTAELEDGHLNAHYRLSLILGRLGNKEEARLESAKFQSLKSKVDCANALIFGTNYLRNGDHRLAEERFTSALRSDPLNPQALCYLGLVQQQKRELNLAAKTFEKALAIQPDLAVAHANLGLTLASLGRAEAARYHLQRGAELDQNDFSVTIAAGRGFLALEDFPRAEVSLSRSLELWPSHAEVLMDLFQLYVLWGKSNEARRFADLAIERSPQDARLHYRIGLFWASQQNFEKARKEFQTAVTLKPAEPLPYLKLAWIHTELNQPEVALRWVIQYLQLIPKSGEGHFLKGKLEFEKGNASGALKELRLAAELSPRDPQIVLLLSRVCQHLGHKEEAEEALRRYRLLASTTSG